MIVVETPGQLGNHMFQLAFAHAASRRLGTSYALGPTGLGELFELRGADPAPAGRRGLARRWHGREAAKVVVDNDRAPAEVLAGLRDGRRYAGFFQSERYFAGWEDDVRRLFTVRPEHQAVFAERFGGLGAYTCVHMRRGDYLDTGVWALPMSYFRDALAVIGRAGSLPVVVVTDDPAHVHDELADGPDVRIEHNAPVIDLMLLMNAAAVVTSNSSFSWWGAWLNRVPEAPILAPEHWLGFAKRVDEPPEVIPERWTRVPVPDAPLRRSAPGSATAAAPAMS